MQKSIFRRRPALAMLSLACSVTGCGLLLGLDEFTDQPPGGPSCSDGERGGDETGVDCGGSCGPCPDGEGCQIGTDCESHVCTSGTCLTASCSDHVTNGTETDVDCGGTACNPCGDGQLCTTANDCTSHVCITEVCQAPTCTDGVKNAFETDIDCGGSVCPGCATDQTCVTNNDCESAICRQGICLNHHIWSKAFSGTASGDMLATTDSAGNTVVLGSLLGTIDLGGGPITNPCVQDPMGWPCNLDWFLAKFDDNGNHVWSRHFRNDNEEEYFSSNLTVATVGAETFLVAHGTGAFDFGGGPLTDPYPCAPPVCNMDIDTAVVKLGYNGNYVWGKRFGDGTDQLGWDGAPGGSGTVVTVGCFQGSLDFGSGALIGAGGFDVFAAKLNGSGQQVWSKKFGAGGNQCARSVAVDAGSNIVVTGYFDGTINFGGGTLASAGNSDIFVTRLDSTGAHLWSTRFGDVQSQAEQVATKRASDSLRVAVDASGNAVVAGRLKGSVDFGSGPLVSADGTGIFIAKLDTTGSLIWSKGFNGSSTSAVTLKHVATDAEGATFLAGSATGTVDFGSGSLSPGGFIVKFDARGVPTWAKSFEGASVNAIATQALQYIVATGSASSATELGGGPLVGGPFLAKFLNP